MLRYTVLDTKPDFVLYLQRDGAPIDLTDADRVDVKLRKPSGAEVNRACTVVSATQGKVTGAWGIGDLNEVGESYLDPIITWAGGIEHSLASVRVLIRSETSE